MEEWSTSPIDYGILGILLHTFLSKRNMADIFCVVAAFLFIAGNVLDIVYMGMYRKRGNINFEEFKDLNPEYLQMDWDFRLQYQPLEMTGGSVNAVAWFIFAIPILKVAWIQSGTGSRQIGLHIAIGVLALGGSSCELLSRMLYMGCSNALEWMASDFNLISWTGDGSNDEIGFRTLAMIDTALSGLLLWIDALEWLFLSGIFVLLYFSVRKNQLEGPSLSKRWAMFGLLLAILGFVEFFASILRFTNWMRYSAITEGVSALNKLFLFPLWLVWLGRQLPQIREVEERGAAINRPDKTSQFVDSSEGNFS